MAGTFSNRLVGQLVQPCPSHDKPDPAHWLEIELLGEDNVGIAWERYHVTLPDGEEVFGYLDENGLARLDQIRPGGTCLIRFPDLDQDAWMKIGT